MSINRGSAMAKKRSGGRARGAKVSSSKGPYEFSGGNRDILYYTGTEALVSGCAGSGKTLACLFKIFYCCEHAPNIRCLIVRKTRAALTQAALATWENKVVPDRHECMRMGGGRKLRSTYEFPNGSEVVIGGMDKPSKIMSTEFDLIYVNEAIELREEDWESLVTRLRNGKLRYQQIFGDTNPDAPTHWLKRRCDTGKTKMFESGHEDNPYLYDKKSSQWTMEGKRYVGNLEKSLSGPRLERLRFGRWSQAEGVVYSDWNSMDNVIDPNQLPGGGPYPPPDWRRIWSVDFGLRDPFVCHVWARDHDGRLYLYKEIYMTGRLVEDHAARMMELWRNEAEYWAKKRRVPVEAAQRQIAPETIVCDHDAEGRGTLERHLGMATTGARKFIKKGIQMVSERLRKDIDGKPRLFVLRNCLDQKDVTLEEGHKPTSILQEIDSYVWNPTKDMPVDRNNHACDSLRYCVAYSDGGMAGMWEVPESILASGRSQDAALDPEPRLRYGVGRTDRRGGKLFGGGA